MKKLLVIISLLPMVAFATTAGVTESAPIDPSDNASLQRGARTFVNNCLNCHSANYMRYNRLVDIGLTEKEIKENLLFAGKKIGDTMTVAMNPKDAKKWFGVTPPDLTVETRARGVDWLYAYMRGFYKDESTSTGWNNIVFDKVAMPHVLYQLQGEQVLNHETQALELVKPGKLNPEEYSAFVADLTNYMAFMAEPAKAERKSLGIWVLLFLGVLLVLAKKVKAAYWKDIN
ncbi:MAG: cytochrome c1 [Methylophilaceae bacterium]|jgi:ubiquinol-cytochrome c reductase cytochrome c1 subunit|nr:cytochrome c1 [Methylophilaceae bacterium]